MRPEFDSNICLLTDSCAHGRPAPPPCACVAAGGLLGGTADRAVATRALTLHAPAPPVARRQDHALPSVPAEDGVRVLVLRVARVRPCPASQPPALPALSSRSRVRASSFPTAPRARVADSGKFPEIVFFGLQYFIKRYLMGPVRPRAASCEPGAASRGYGRHARLHAHARRSSSNTTARGRCRSALTRPARGRW